MRLYSDLADWFHLLTAPADYADEAAEYQRVTETGCSVPLRTLLELGCGGGNTARTTSGSWERGHLRASLRP